MLDVCGDLMAVYSGDDGTATELMLMGARGNISVTANVAPAELAEVCRLALAGESGKARALDARLQPLHDALFVESNPIPVKWAVAQQGRCGGTMRLPMTELAAQYQPQVRAILQELGLL